MTFRLAVSALIFVALAGELVAQPNPAYAQRRERLRRRVGTGVVIVQSQQQTQPNLYEFLVDDADNHDFVYLTGLSDLESRDSALVLLPASTSYPEILYTSDDPQYIAAVTGIKTILPMSRFLEDLSNALTDYSLMRITQKRRKPISTEISAQFGSQKVLYYNYPRFVNLGEPPPPRLELPKRLATFSPELVVKDASRPLALERMIHDRLGIENLTRATAITGEGLGEIFRTLRPGMTERDIAARIDYVYRNSGATLGFPTGVTIGVRPTPRREFTEGVDARAGAREARDGDLVHIDTGAAFGHYSADAQRIIPVSGRFTDEQRKIYEIVLNVQKGVIGAVKPGVTFQQLHDMAVRMLDEAGGYAQYYSYGIGHFIGMEVHDVGDNLTPFKPGVALSIEQGVSLPTMRVAFEDDVLVTETGHTWMTENVPIEMADVERAVAAGRRAAAGPRR